MLQHGRLVLDGIARDVLNHPKIGILFWATQCKSTMNSGIESVDSIKLAVIGTGLIGQTHLKLIHASTECQVVAICDPNPTAIAIAEQYNVPVYQEYLTLLEDCIVDGAIIAAPTDLHTEIGIACADRGVHILVEKPIAATVADAQKLIEVADQSSIQILVGHHRRHNPLVQQARALVQGGDIGELVTVSAYFLLKKPDDYFDTQWRTLRPGGGPAMINIIHDLDNLRYICGDIRQVFAQMSTATRGFDVEDALSVNLSFTNGALGSILGADTTPAPWSYELTSGENPIYPNYPEACYRFCGTAGSFAFPQMTIWHYTDETQVGWLEPLAQSPAFATQDPRPRTGSLVAQLEHFCRVIRGTSTPLVSGTDATKSLAVVLAILESAQTDLPVLL